MRYDLIDPRRVTETLETLQKRIQERFPDSNLLGVCETLVRFSNVARRRSRSIARPNIFLRFVQLLILLSFGLGAIWVGRQVEFPLRLQTGSNALSVFEGVEAIINLLILLGAGAFFVFTLEERMKRRRALSDLHRLRSITHVIDMHQLTKDPAAILNHGPRTASSPVRDMTEFELTRYLDYCTEMLSLAGKLSALYAQSSNDPVVINTASDLERMTANLASKIWQKIMTIQPNSKSG